MPYALENLQLPPVPDAAARLSGCVRTLAEDLGAQEIWVYGSVARGEAGPDSDVDLLIVGDDASGSPALSRRAARRLAPLQGALPIGLQVISPEQWRLLQDDHATLIPEIRKKGVRVYARHA
jgi:predicted nucleotidyltransferase